jgi:hypothetical protein
VASIEVRDDAATTPSNIDAHAQNGILKSTTSIRGRKMKGHVRPIVSNVAAARNVPLVRRRTGPTLQQRNTKAVPETPAVFSGHTSGREDCHKLSPSEENVLHPEEQVHNRTKRVSKVARGTTLKRGCQCYFVAKQVYVDTSLCEL